MTYPLEFEFKVLALAPQFYVKEDITVFENQSQTTPIYKIKANQWIDWSASYILSDAAGNELGRMGRKGGRSLWKATYEIFDSNNQKEFKIEEDNAFVKIMDAVFSEIPILGIFTGYVFNPKYNIFNESGEKVAQLTKDSSFLGKKFKLHQLSDLNPQEEERIILSLMMMVLLERSRG